MAAHPDTLRDLVNSLDTDPRLSSARRRHVVCSVRRIAAALDRPPEDLPANWAQIRGRVEAIQPAHMRWTPRTFANHKANLRSALTFYAAAPMHVPKERLTGKWHDLWRLISCPERRKRLSSFFRYASAQGLDPVALTEADLDAFMRFRLETSPYAYAISDRRRVAQMWNALGNEVVGWPDVRFTIPADGRYKGPAWEAYPASLRDEVDRHFEAMIRQTRVRALRPSGTCSPRTVQTRKREFIAYLGKAVAIGFPMSSFTSLARALQPEVVERVVDAYWAENGELPKTYTVDLAWRLQLMARRARCLSEADLERISAVRAAAERKRPDAMTAKNRKVIRAVTSTDGWSRVCHLPFDLMAEARRERSTHQLKAARKALQAVAIAILTVNPVRIGNLISTKLDEHLFKLAGPDGCYWLEYQPHEVKNNLHLQTELDTETTALLDEYIQLHRPVLARHSNEQWLFPGAEGGHKAAHQLSAQMRDLIEKRTGLRVTAHQFRHAAAAMLLQKYPNNWPLIAKILGHKGWTTTVKNYAEVDRHRGQKLFMSIVAELRTLGQAA